MNELQVVVVLSALLAGLISAARAEEASAPDPGWGSIDGQFLLDGPDEPQHAELQDSPADRKSRSG